MYGKMQESGLTELIPLICTSPVWGQYPVFSHPEFPQGSLYGVAAVWWLLDGGYSFLPKFPQGSAAHIGGLQALLTVTSFVYWYGWKYSISPMSEELTMGENADRKQEAKNQSSPCQRIILKLLLYTRENDWLIDWLIDWFNPAKAKTGFL